MLGLTKPTGNEVTLQSTPVPIPVNIIEFTVLTSNMISYIGYIYTFKAVLEVTPITAYRNIFNTRCT